MSKTNVLILYVVAVGIVLGAGLYTGYRDHLRDVSLTPPEDWEEIERVVECYRTARSLYGDKFRMTLDNGKCFVGKR